MNNKIKITIGIISFMLLNLSVLLNFSGEPFLSLLNALFLFFIPGYLLFKILEIESESQAEQFGFSVGLSIFVLLSLGLFINSIFPLFGITNPLRDIYILISLDIFILNEVLVLLIQQRVQDKNASNKQLNPNIKLNLTTKLIFIISLAMPILSLIGALLLNKNGTNVITLAAISLVPTVLIITVSLHKRLNSSIFPWILICMSTALLFMFSMRSNYLMGWDVQNELKVFQITKQQQLWSQNNTVQGYNSTLAVTILPTMINAIIQINDYYIYKLIYPIVFSTISIIVYAFFIKHTRRIEAFLAVVFFIFQFQFMQQMPALARQEIGMLFFALIILTLFKEKISGTKQLMLYIFFSFGMVVSHYSTAYIAIGLLLSTYLAIKMINAITYFIAKVHFTEKCKVNFVHILILSTFTFLWYGIINDSGQYVVRVAEKTLAAINRINADKVRTEDARISIIGTAEPVTQKTISRYASHAKTDYQETKKWIIPAEGFDDPKYAPQIKFSKKITPRFPQLYEPASFIIELAKKFVKFIAFIGLSFYLLRLIRHKQLDLSLNVLVMTATMLVFIAAIILVPNLSFAYNIERLYQQALIILGIVIVSASMLIQYKIPYTLKLVNLGIVFTIYYFYSTGLSSQLFGGDAYVNLNNYGDGYDRYYIQEGEFEAGKWLQKNFAAGNLVMAEEYASLRLNSSFPELKSTITDITPGSIDINAYVYQSYTNKITGLAKKNFEGKNITYSYPSQFLLDKKDQIYVNKNAGIFK